MKGMRPLSREEILRVMAVFSGTYAVRDHALFLLGISVGGRVSELLSLEVHHVWEQNQPVSHLHFDKSIVKGGEVSRTVPVNADGQKAIRMLIGWHREMFGNLNYGYPLFISRNSKGTTKPIGRRMADVVFKRAFVLANLTGNLSTHTLRKTFAQRLYDATGDIYIVQEMLGHKSVATTQKYLGVNYADVQMGCLLYTSPSPRDS